MLVRELTSLDWVEPCATWDVCKTKPCHPSSKILSARSLWATHLVPTSFTGLTASHSNKGETCGKAYRALLGPSSDLKKSTSVLMSLMASSTLCAQQCTGKICLVFALQPRTHTHILATAPSADNPTSFDFQSLHPHSVSRADTMASTVPAALAFERALRATNLYTGMLPCRKRTCTISSSRVALSILLSIQTQKKSTFCSDSTKSFLISSAMKWTNLLTCLGLLHPFPTCKPFNPWSCSRAGKSRNGRSASMR